MEQILQKTLRDNEKVLWFGRPTKTSSSGPLTVSPSMWPGSSPPS